MRFILRLAACLFCFAAPGAWGQQVAFKRCLSATDLQVEQLVRHGVFLREAGRRCDEMMPGTAKLWTDFDQKFGPRLKQQTDRRVKMFSRAFKEDALKVRTYFDGRLVTYHRNYPLGTAYCSDIKDMLTTLSKRGWGGFAEQAKVVQNEVQSDYKICGN